MNGFVVVVFSLLRAVKNQANNADDRVTMAARVPRLDGVTVEPDTMDVAVRSVRTSTRSHQTHWN